MDNFPFINENVPNLHDFLANIIHGKCLPAQVNYYPKTPLDSSSYDANYSTMHLLSSK